MESGVSTGGENFACFAECMLVKERLISADFVICIPCYISIIISLLNFFLCMLQMLPGGRNADFIFTRFDLHHVLCLREKQIDYWIDNCGHLGKNNLYRQNNLSIVTRIQV